MLLFFIVKIVFKNFKLLATEIQKVNIQNMRNNSKYICHGRKSSRVEFQILLVESPIKEILVLTWGRKSKKLGRQSNCSKSG